MPPQLAPIVFLHVPFFRRLRVCSLSVSGVGAVGMAQGGSTFFQLTRPKAVHLAPADPRLINFWSPLPSVPVPTAVPTAAVAAAAANRRRPPPNLSLAISASLAKRIRTTRLSTHLTDPEAKHPPATVIVATGLCRHSTACSWPKFEPPAGHSEASP
ncbi:hypothetical protein CPAR01_07815 [Colletotrichum paranaense]|uniref:Secreted protein n=1 Tax=Colletotrichum paranaense TaxID=1914294 RepID=A0ABQ9SJQ0_9PEZI|nr:uncharacterized protein CPAR01_07815 [Colletotrichum paranaense]KAK1537702.1 hypothetical protein CPAR01_07815 [Colletotrichum paranaense]